MNTVHKVYMLTTGTKYLVVGRIPGQDLVMYENDDKAKAVAFMSNYPDEMVLTEEIKEYKDTRMNCCF